MIYFTSDTHWGHANIIKYCNRPFKDAREMDEVMIKNWNSVVKPEDTIYHIGDFAFYRDQKYTREVIGALNGDKKLIKGNHDEYLDDKTLKMFNGVYQYYELNVRDTDTPRGKQMIVLMHYAMRVWNKSHHGSWMLYGHSHGKLPDDPGLLSIDVGSDCHGYTPISYNNLKSIMSAKVFKPVDGHGSSSY